MSHQVSVRSAVFESLQFILSPDKKARESGEEKLKALEVTEDFGLVLTELCINDKENGSIKQLAAVLLRQYVDTHWSELSEKFSPPETPNHIKSGIRALIPHGLTESDSRVRATVAYVISSIATWDWPDNWPELFDILMSALGSSDTDAVHGSMRVLTEFTRDISDTQMVKIAPVLLPQLYRIFVTTGQYSNRARSRAVVIFSTCVNVIIELSQVEKQAVKQLLVPVLPKFVEAFLEALQSSDDAVTDTGIKTDIMKALTVLLKTVPSYMGAHFKSIVMCIWQLLVNSSELYVKTNVHDDPDGFDGDPVDSDGEVLGSEALIYSVFEFIHVLVDMRKFHSVIKENIKQLLYYVTIYTQMTSEQETCWLQSAGQFVEDEDDESFSFSVRISAQDLLQAIIAEFDDEGLIALAENITTHMTQAQQLKQTGNQYWWKIHESVMLAMGGVRLMFIGAIKEGKVKFDFADFLQNVILSDLANPDTPFLTGRCLWTAGKFSHYMEPAIIQKFLEATVTALGEGQPAPVRISAVRAVYFFCDNLIANSQTALLSPALPAMYESVMSIAQSYDSEVLGLSLDSMEHLLKADSEFAASVAEKSIPFFMAVFLKYSHDMHVIEICKELIMQLAVVRNDIIQQKMLPTLVSIIQQRTPDTLPSSLQPGSLEMVETLVRGSNEPISEDLMAVFPMVANLTIGTDDSSIMQNGGECLRAYISKSAQQVVLWQDDRGNTGLQIIGLVVSKLLDPKSSEFSASYVGKLVSLLITKLSSSIGSDLDLILRAVLSKLQQVETSSIVQELIMVFARLVIHRVEALLDFLTMTPGPDGSPALKFVLTNWCSRQHLFFGSYDTKVTTMALSKLLQHAINTNDSRLQDIYLKEEVIAQSNVIRTRAKAKASSVQWIDTPILIKMYKLLINELALQIEEAQFTTQSNGHTVNENGDRAGDSDGFEDDDDEDEEDDHNFLSDLIDTTGFLDEDAEEEDDPDVLSDPIYHMNLREYLAEFIKSFTQTQFYETFKSSLTAREVSILKHIGIS